MAFRLLDRATFTSLQDNSHGGLDVAPETNGVHFSQFFQFRDPLVDLRKGIRAKPLNHLMSRFEAFLHGGSHLQCSQSLLVFMQNTPSISKKL